MIHNPQSDERMVWQTLIQIEAILKKSLEVQEETHRLLKRSQPAILDELNEQTEEMKTQTALLQQIADGLTPQPLTGSISVQFTGDAIMADNALVFNVGQTSTASIQPFLADGTTPSGGTLSNVSYTFSDPSATVVLNSDGLTALCTGVADSAGVAVAGSASATVTDTDGVVSTWSQPFTITTAAVVVPPQQLTQSVAVQFTTPA
jgi:hypothetical protein